MMTQATGNLVLIGSIFFCLIVFATVDRRTRRMFCWAFILISVLFAAYMIAVPK